MSCVKSPYGPQAAWMVGHLRFKPRSQAAMAVLDQLRDRGPMTTDDLQVAVGHAHAGSVLRHLADMEAEGLVERTYRGRNARNVYRRSTLWYITEHGHAVI